MGIRGYPLLYIIKTALLAGVVAPILTGSGICQIATQCFFVLTFLGILEGLTQLANIYFKHGNIAKRYVL